MGRTHCHRPFGGAVVRSLCGTRYVRGKLSGESVISSPQAILGFDLLYPREFAFD